MKKYSVEFSVYHSFSVSYSKLKIKNDVIKSPPKFNVGGFGIKIQFPIFKKYKNIYFTSHIGGMDLSTTCQFQYRLPLDSIKPTTGFNGVKSKTTFNMRYTYYSIGLKKSIPSKKKLKFNIETGLRLLVNVNATRDTNFLDIWQFDNVLVYRKITFNHSRKFTLLPYVAVGFDYKIKNFKFGFQLWVQKSFQNMTDYDFKLRYPSFTNPILDYNSKVNSKGFAWGNNIYIVLKTF